MSQTTSSAGLLTPQETTTSVHKTTVHDATQSGHDETIVPVPLEANREVTCAKQETHGISEVNALGYVLQYTRSMYIRIYSLFLTTTG